MTKVTIVGAGGFVFPLTMIRDVLSFPALQDVHFSLMDINADNLARTYGHAKRLVEEHNLPATVEATTDRRAALDGADFIVVTFQVGGLEAYEHDVEIPRKYGLDQTVGDTLEETREHALELGAKGFLTKPLDLDVLPTWPLSSQISVMLAQPC